MELVPPSPLMWDLRIELGSSGSDSRRVSLLNHLVSSVYHTGSLVVADVGHLV